MFRVRINACALTFLPRAVSRTLAALRRKITHQRGVLEQVGSAMRRLLVCAAKTLLQPEAVNSNGCTHQQCTAHPAAKVAEAAEAAEGTLAAHALNYYPTVIDNHLFDDQEEVGKPHVDRWGPLETRLSRMFSLFETAPPVTIPAKSTLASRVAAMLGTCWVDLVEPATPLAPSLSAYLCDPCSPSTCSSSSAALFPCSDHPCLDSKA